MGNVDVSLELALDTPTSLDVDLINDTIIEGNEFFTVRVVEVLDEMQPYIIVPAESPLQVTILDDDGKLAIDMHNIITIETIGPH